MNEYAMSKKTVLCLALALSLGGCGVTPETGTGKPAKTYEFDWPKEGIRATFEYNSVQLFQPKPVCAGKVSIENYGNKNYSRLYFRVSVFSASKALIATDRFLLIGSINSGSRAEIPADQFNTLSPVVITTSFSECPKDMDSATVQLEALEAGL
jgi:hypothetical protein